jgi:hypothetical protein
VSWFDASQKKPMTLIGRPMRPQNHPDALLDLQNAIEERFRSLIDDAKEAGWDEVMVAVAIGELADNYVLALAEHSKVAKHLAGVRIGGM